MKTWIFLLVSTWITSAGCLDESELVLHENASSLPLEMAFVQRPVIANASMECPTIRSEYALEGFINIIDHEGYWYAMKGYGPISSDFGEGFSYLFLTYHTQTGQLEVGLLSEFENAVIELDFALTVLGETLIEIPVSELTGILYYENIAYELEEGILTLQLPKMQEGPTNLSASLSFVFCYTVVDKKEGVKQDCL